ncbi:MAG: SAV_2336 N-terminal domain-related protein, partial [Blastocatellia bacterium]
FRDVRAWVLDTDQARAALRLGSPEEMDETVPARGANELADAAGRRLILVVSDCYAPAWHSGDAWRMLAGWGRRTPVTLAQVLPRRFWPGTTMTPVDAVLRAHRPGVNTTLEITPAWYRDIIREGGIALPVVSLDEWSIGPWAKLVAGSGGFTAQGLIIPPLPEIDDAAEAANAAQSAGEEIKRAPEELVREYMAMATPVAQRLAAHMAAVPLTLPVMQLAQQTMVPEARQSHMAEFVLGGLVYKPAAPAGRKQKPGDTMYEFYPGVRELLLSRVSRHETVRVIGAVSRYIEQRLGETEREIDARLVVSGQGTMGGRKPVDALSRRFAEVSTDVLRYIGGYDHYVKEIERRIPLRPASGQKVAPQTPQVKPTEEAPARSPEQIRARQAELERTLAAKERELAELRENYLGANPASIMIDDFQVNHGFAREREIAGLKAELDALRETSRAGEPDKDKETIENLERKLAQKKNQLEAEMERLPDEDKNPQSHEYYYSRTEGTRQEVAALEKALADLQYQAPQIVPGDAPDDPWKGVFGGQSERNHRRLTAKVTPVPGSVETNNPQYMIDLTVRSTDQEQHPLAGAVTFYLHPTFANDKPVSPVGKDGIAEQIVIGWGAFTAGASMDMGRTLLELDLAELTDAPEAFRNVAPFAGPEPAPGAAEPAADSRPEREIRIQALAGQLAEKEREMEGLNRKWQEMHYPSREYDAYEAGVIEPKSAEIAALKEELAELQNHVPPPGAPEPPHVPVQAEILNLARQYEQLRRDLPSGNERTGQMEQVIAEMRARASEAKHMLPELAASRSPGQRLAAVAILNVMPDPEHIKWLGERMEAEKPFIGYHAARALLAA